jgi:hypothetical protein
MLVGPPPPALRDDPHLLFKCLITSNIRRIFYTFFFFLVEKLRCVLNSRNVHLSNLFFKTDIQKLDAS